MTNQGTLGWNNWAYAGTFSRSDDSRSVSFSAQQSVDLDPPTPYARGSVDFDNGAPNDSGCTNEDGSPNGNLSVPTANDEIYSILVQENGAGATATPERIISAITEAFNRCHPDKNILVTRSVTDLRFSSVSDLKHVAAIAPAWDSGDAVYDVYTLGDASVTQMGDGGNANWGFYGWFDTIDVQIGNATHRQVVFYPTGDSDGDSDGDGGTIPDLGANPATFTVNTNGSTFTASQPADSVATYVYRLGERPSTVTLTSATDGGLRYALDTYDLTSSGDASTTISVDPSARHQQVDGFGGALTDSAASLLQSGEGGIQQLFGTGDDGIGLTIARSPMGSSDLMADGDDVHTYEDQEESFGVASHAADQRQIAMLQAAKSAAGGDFKVLGTPWTAPGWAKKSGQLSGNECGTDENELDVTKVDQYAAYFRKYVDAYDSYGIKPWMVSMQNEPENCKTEMPTTLLSPTDEVALSKALAGSLSGTGVKVLGWDPNWNDPQYVDQLVRDGRVDAIGYHCYDGTPYGAQTTAKPTLMTECSGFTDQNASTAQNLGWEVANLLMGPMRNGSTGSVYWSLVQNADGSPHLNTAEACQNCRGLLTANGDGTFTPSQDYYYYGQFSRFVRPGAARVDSSNNGDLSSIAFTDGDTVTLVVLNSATRADGGSAGSSTADYRRSIVQWDNGGNGQNPSWIVGADGYRRWISDISTYQCLHDGAGIPDEGPQPGGVLDKYINLKDVWAVCGAAVMGTGSELERGTYLASSDGGRLTLDDDGRVVATDRDGTQRWAAGVAGGDRLILQPDGNLVLYDGMRPIWATGTDGKGGAWLSIRGDGTFIVSTRQDETIWVSKTGADSYRGQLVQWDGDNSAQKSTWQVGYDGNRRWVADHDTFQCLHDAGAGNSITVTSDTLDTSPNLDGVWAVCGTDRMGRRGELLPGTYLKAGDYTLLMQDNGDLVLRHNGTDAIWSTATNDGAGKYVELQDDGNLVLYAGTKPVWATGTAGTSPGWLVLGDDGSLRLYDGDGKEVWSR